MSKESGLNLMPLDQQQWLIGYYNEMHRREMMENQQLKQQQNEFVPSQDRTTEDGSDFTIRENELRRQQPREMSYIERIRAQEYQKYNVPIPSTPIHDETPISEPAEE
jgi:hypothetical protein